MKQKIKKSKITINGFDYVYIKSYNLVEKHLCERFIRNKKDTYICWDIFSQRRSRKGPPLERTFWFNNLKHRDDGFAHIITNDKGEEVIKKLYIDGKELLGEEKQNEIRRVNLEMCLENYEEEE